MYMADLVRVSAAHDEGVGSEAGQQGPQPVQRGGGGGGGRGHWIYVQEHSMHRNQWIDRVCK